MRTIKTILLLLAAAATNVFAQSSPNFMVDEWQRAKIYTKEYLDAMPEGGYNFKPTPEVNTFAQQYVHLAAGNYRLASTAINKPNPYPGGRETEPKISSKESVTKFVTDSYDYVIEGLKTLTETQLKENVTFGKLNPTREQLFFKVFEHQTHHRGQTTIYLRLKGVVPPHERLF